MPSTRRWRGNAPSVAQVQTVTIYHVEVGVVYTLTNGGKSVSVTAVDGDTTTTIMTALAAAWNAQVFAQFTEITAEAVDATITLTADNSGVPFDLTASQTGTGGNVEIKTVTISHSPTGGTWLWIDSVYGTSSALAYNISAADLTDALELIYGNLNVVATGSAGGPYTVTFGGDLTNTNIPDVTFDNSSLTGGNGTVSVVETRKGAAGTSEVQTITFYGSPAAGTFVASFGGYSTTALAYNISAADFQTALRLLTPIGATGVTVSGSAGGPYTVTFAGTLANTAVAMIEIDATLLTGGTISGAIATTTAGVDGINEVQYVTQGTGVPQTYSLEKTGTVSGGTFRLSYDSLANIVYTDPIPFDATLGEIIAIFAALIQEEEGSTYRGPQLAAVYDSDLDKDISQVAYGLVMQAIGYAGNAEMSASNVLGFKEIGIDDSSLTGGGSYLFPGPMSSSLGQNGELFQSGKFTLTFGGQVTAELTYTAAASTYDMLNPTPTQVQSALEALSTIQPGNVRVTAWPGQTGLTPYGTAKGMFVVEFINALSSTPLSKLTFQGTGGGLQADVYTKTNGVSGVNEVQTLTLSGTPSQGTFTISYGSETTGPIAYNAIASAVDTALEALTAIPAGGITCTGGGLPGTPVVMSFSGALIAADLAQMICNDSGLKSSVVETTPGVTTADEIQTITLTGNPHGGTATLTYNAHTTSSLAYNATATDVQNALIALSDFAPGDVVCTGGPWPAAIACTFGAAFAATDVALMTGTGTSLSIASVAETSINPLTYDVTTASSGPNDNNVAANWSGETLPVAGDSVVFDQGNVSVLWNLDKLATGLAAFDVYARYTGTIGLPEVQQQFGVQYYEYREQYLTVDSPTINIGAGDGNGSQRLKVKGVVGTPVTVNVYQTDNALDQGLQTLLLVLPNTTALNVNRGSVGVAVYPGETSVVPMLRVGYMTSKNGDSTVVLGSGVTLTTIEQSGGLVVTNSAITTLNMTDGELKHQSGTAGTLNIDGGAVRYTSSATGTLVNIGSDGILDLSQDLRARTFTNININSGGSYLDPHGSAILTNGIKFVRCQPSETTFEIKPDYVVKLS